MGKQKNRRQRRNRDGPSPDTRLHQTLERAGLKVCLVEPDGNCLFRAFARQFCGNEENYHEFRLSCCNYIQEQAEFFDSFLDDMHVTDYVMDMMKDGTWGTQIEIVALCKLYEADCVIFRQDGLHYRVECAIHLDEPKHIILLSHHDEEHFNEVCFKEKGRTLKSFEELELLLSDEDGAPGRLSKRESRRNKRQQMAPIVVTPERVLDV